jgi:hypothetical protein
VMRPAPSREQPLPRWKLLAFRVSIPAFAAAGAATILLTGSAPISGSRFPACGHRRTGSAIGANRAS